MIMLLKYCKWLVKVWFNIESKRKTLPQTNKQTKTSTHSVLPVEFAGYPRMFIRFGMFLTSWRYESSPV